MIGCDVANSPPVGGGRMTNRITFGLGHGPRRNRRRRQVNAARVLLVDGDAGVRGAWANALGESGAALHALHAADVRGASEAVLLGHPELVIVSLDLPGHAQGG